MNDVKPTYEELEAEVALLRHKISPLEDKEFTEELAFHLGMVDLSSRSRKFRGGSYIVVYPAELYQLLFGRKGNAHELVKMGRSLQALLWERSALHGDLCFVMETDEYRATL